MVFGTLLHNTLKIIHTPGIISPTVEQALGWAGRIGAQHTWLTHIAHELGHEETNRVLPEGVRLAYDGLNLPVNLNPVNL